MTKYSYEWFIAQSKAAQESVKKWPEAMKENIVVGVATLPVLGEGRSQSGEQPEKAGGENMAPKAD